MPCLGLDDAVAQLSPLPAKEEETLGPLQVPVEKVASFVVYAHLCICSFNLLWSFNL